MSSTNINHISTGATHLKLPTETSSLNTSLGIQLEHYEGEKIEWEERPTCWMSTAPQPGPLWKRLRTGAITMSAIAGYIGRSSFGETPEVSAQQICGLSDKIFTPEQIFNMGVGTSGEPHVRNWYQQELTRQAIQKSEVPPIVKEVGIAVWKQDPRFRASMDGDVSDTLFVEIKIPKNMYRPLIEHIEAIKKGFTPPPFYHEHIYNSHYDQMTGNCIITGKTHADYVVYSPNEKVVYTERITINPDHWYQVLYPKGVEFYEQHVAPLMVKHKIYRIDP